MTEKDTKSVRLAEHRIEEVEEYASAINDSESHALRELIRAGLEAEDEEDEHGDGCWVLVRESAAESAVLVVSGAVGGFLGGFIGQPKALGGATLAAFLVVWVVVVVVRALI